MQVGINETWHQHLACQVDHFGVFIDQTIYRSITAYVKNFPISNGYGLRYGILRIDCIDVTIFKNYIRSVLTITVTRDEKQACSESHGTRKQCTFLEMNRVYMGHHFRP